MGLGVRAVLIGLWLVTGCASTQGWELSRERTCVARQAPRVCVQADPDHGHVLALGDVELLPGECVEAGDEARGGLLKVSGRDRADHRSSRWLRVARGKVTMVRVEKDGRMQGDRLPCEGLPIEPSRAADR